MICWRKLKPTKPPWSLNLFKTVCCRDVKIAEKLESDLEKIEKKMGYKINELMDLGVKV